MDRGKCPPFPQTKSGTAARAVRRKRPHPPHLQNGTARPGWSLRKRFRFRRIKGKGVGGVGFSVVCNVFGPTGRAAVPGVKNPHLGALQEKENALFVCKEPMRNLF